MINTIELSADCEINPVEIEINLMAAGLQPMDGEINSNIDGVLN